MVSCNQISRDSVISRLCYVCNAILRHTRGPALRRSQRFNPKNVFFPFRTFEGMREMKIRKFDRTRCECRMEARGNISIVNLERVEARVKFFSSLIFALQRVGGPQRRSKYLESERVLLKTCFDSRARRYLL